MTEQMEEDAKPDRTRGTAHRVRLPGFISGEEIGLGEVIQRATSYVGIKPCGGCLQRAQALNQWMAFTSRRSK